MNNNDNPNQIRDAIGYVRVSTRLQEQNERGLQNQIQRIRQWASQNGWRVGIIYQDVASAAGPQNAMDRPEFRQAVDEALKAGVPLVVTDPTRLSRDLASLDRLVIDRGLTVISLEDGGEVPVGMLRQRVAHGAATAKRISKGTKDALRAANGIRKSGTRDVQKAAQASARIRVFKKNEVIEQVVDHLMRNPGLRAAPSHQLADALNEAGISTGWSRPWTAGGVRAKKREIQSQLDFRDELASDAPDLEASRWGEPSRSSGGNDALTPDEVTGGSAPGRLDDPAARHPALEDENDESEMRKQPLYGMF